MLKSACLYAIVFLSTHSALGAINNGDCLGEDALIYFGISPGGYDASRPMDSESCKKLCADLKLPYAGIQGGHFCFCSSETAVEKLTPKKGSRCSSRTDWTEFYFAKPILKFKGIVLTPSTKIVNVGTALTFDLQETNGAKGEFNIDFGDASGQVHGMLGTNPSYTYYIPGIYKVTAVIWPTGGPPSYRLITSATITVLSTLDANRARLMCPSVIEPGEEFICNVTMIGGENIQGDLDFGDGRQETVHFPDACDKRIGINVPQELTQEMRTDTEIHRLVVIPGSAVSEEQHITAVHTFSVKTGDLKILILQPECLQESCSSYKIICPSDGSFCPKFRDCVRMAESQCTSYVKRGRYSVRQEIPIKIKRAGFNIYPLSKPIPIKPGEMLGLSTESATIASRTLRPTEVEDLTIAKGSRMGESFRTEDLTPSGRKYFVSCVAEKPSIIYLKHTYAAGGLYALKLSLIDQKIKKPIELQKKLNVQFYLKGLKLRVNPLFVVAGTEVQIEATLEGGSDVNVVWDFGDGKKIKEVIEGANGRGQQLSQNYTYEKPGVYTIKLMASNLLGQRSAKQSVVVQYPVTDSWSISSNSPQLLPGFLKINLMHTTLDSLPTNATARISFGDGKLKKWTIPLTGPSKLDKAFDHKYAEPGVYQIRVNMSNLVSFKLLATEVEVLRKIVNFTANAQIKPPEIADYRPGYGEHQNKFPIGESISFFLDIESGDVEYYVVELLNGTVLSNSTEKLVVLNFHQAGCYNMSFYAYNHIQEKTDPVLLTVYVMENVRGLQLIDDVNATNDDSEKYLEFKFGNIGTDTCLVVNYGDDTIKRAFGFQETCYGNYSEYEIVWEGELENPHFLQHTYTKSGEMTIYAVAFNDISHVSANISFNVSDLNCKPPILSIRHRVTNLYQAPENFRNLATLVHSGTTVMCNYTHEVIRFWEAFETDNSTGETIHELDLTPLDSSRKSNLYIPPFFLQPGYYKFLFHVNLTAPDMYPPKPLHRYISTYVKILPSPIVVQMADGAQSRVTRGWGQTLKLNPAKNSIDPDNRKNKNFQIEWYCRRLPDETIDRALDDSEQPISTPLFKRLPPGQEQDEGGCFGKGPGKINITGGTIKWNTTVFQKPNEIYELLVKVSLPGRKPSWGGIRVVLLDTLPPSIEVKCQTEKLCYPFEPIGQTINPVRVALIGLCSEDCQGELVYEWQIYGVNNSTEVLLPEAEEFLVGADKEVMALSVEFFKIFYPMFGDFIAKLSVTNEENQRGESDLFLHINQPPEGGNCTMWPLEGKALLDVFSVVCKGWLDPEGKSIEHFAFWTINVETGTMLYLSAGPDYKASLVLPYGVFQLGVDIKDKDGALTRENLTIIATEAPTKPEYDFYVRDRRLESVNASGDQGRMNQVSQALSSLMNVQLVDDTAEYEIILLENGTSAADRDLEEKAITRVKMLQSVGNVMNTDTLSDLEQMGSALTTIAGRGTGLDNDGKNEIVRLLKKTVLLASSIKVEAPQQMLDFCMYAVGTMGGVVARMSEQLVTGVVLPTDRAKAMHFEYDVEVPLYGEEQPEYLFDGTVPLQEALSKAVIEKERVEAEGQIAEMVDLTIKLVLTMLKNIIVGESPLEFMAPSGLGLTISMYKGGALSNKSIQHGEATYVFPDVCDILANRGCSGNETIGVMAVSWPSILQSYGDSVDVLSKNTQTLQLLLLDEDMNILDVSNTTDTFSIHVPRASSGADKTQVLPEPTYFHPIIKWNEPMIYHQFIVEKADSAVNIEITPTDQTSRLLVYLKHREKPQLYSYDLLIPIQDVRNVNGTYDIFLRNEVIANRTGFFYLGVVEMNDTYSGDVNWGEELNLTSGEVSRQFSTNYSVRIYTSGCYFFDHRNKRWSGAGCVVENANQAVTHCKCNHLTSFGSGFFVTPNTVDFSYVFANAGFADNITIYMTIIITFGIYIMLMIWARYKDRKDVEKIGSTPMADNDVEDKYFYEVVIFTGNKDGAGTDSKVQFIMSGDDDETDVRSFGDTKRKIFRRNAMDSFVMAVPRPLGRLNYIRIWHDNSGNGKFRSWFLSFIVVRDIQTGEKYEFISNRWFAVEKDDGQIDRLLPVAGKGEATEFYHLFHLTTRKNLADGHLWFSVFMRPPQSRFTRVQRVSCCWALLYLSMLVNAMWYGRVPGKPGDSAINVGPFSLSPEQIGVGVMSNLIVFPPSFLIITLFRKARLRQLRPSHINVALKKQKQYRPSGSASSSRCESRSSCQSTSQVLADKRPILQVNKSKKFLLPWWCRYVAWALCLLSMGVSAFFLWAYGVEFGDEKTKKWVTSLMISFFTSVLVTQPIKVFLVAMIFSSICKSVDNDKDDTEDDEEPPDLGDDEEWLHKGAVKKSARRRLAIKKVNVEAVQRAREERMKELHMNAIIVEIISYLFFLWILIILSYGNRDPSAFYMQQNLANHFIRKGQSDAFPDIVSSARFYNWTRNVLVPNLQVSQWYNGDQPFGMRGFIDDKVNRMMGYAVLRQIRVKPDSCKVPEEMQKLVSHCRSFSNLIDEDSADYKPGWKPIVEHSNVTVIDEYYYRTASELDGIPFWAQLDVYGGGGYVFPLRGKKSVLKEGLTRLETSDWIDGGTRAVFTEFSVYNAQVNLFGVATLVIEFTPGGGITPFYRIDAIRLMRYHQGFGLFVLICELIYVIYTIYFTVRELKAMIRDKVEYFKSYWSWCEMMLMGLSYAAITVYIYRMVNTYKILKIFDRTHGNGYVKLQFVAAVDELFGYLSSFLIFLAILKFIKLLRFNRRMGILYSTLAQCSIDLKSFAVVFCVIYFAFVQTFYILFGSTLMKFSTLVRTAETSFSMMRGKFNFDEMSHAAPVLGPLIFMIFAFITSIVLINIFITLIISAFQTVKNNIGKQNNEYEIVNFMLGKFRALLGFGGGSGQFNPDSKSPSLEEQIEEFPEKVNRLMHYIDNVYFDGKMDIDSRQALKRMYGKRHNRVHPDKNRTPILDWKELPVDEQKLD